MVESEKKNLVILGIGGNIGGVIKRFHKLYLMLKHDTRFTLLKTSPILKNPPFGFLEQNDFYNAVIVLKTNLSSIEMLNATQRYEKRLKRVRSFQDAPRTLDIDILFFQGEVKESKRLTLPHPGILQRASVLIPLSLIQ
jgi:2-amino-4-hydroxy-6-hydroxymethyldihydropteridine diphosphokinase